MKLERIGKVLDATTGAVAAVALFAIMWLMLFDVTGRKFLSNSITGALELTEILMVVVIFGALPLVSWRSEHVVFDSLDNLIPKGLKRLQARLVHLVCAGVFTLLAWLLTQRAARFAEYGETTVQLLLPMAPVAWGMAVLLLLTAIVHVAFVVSPPMPGSHQAPVPGEGSPS